ncbi:LytR family transcriptional attenuator [Melghiribacillus thermohalophilus]|uniref:LytR family transcriptional attenuator n=1 Tax=Melghiribacillus thermohalophilus TaxID=1324956 RepID=A0A4R3MZX4_9BACI|nr:LCP family protein [Melghiribacillus thermohalophilus]TCT19889.1 LytR family transcriptional attenuator [Melghiribacillus thermohalophilus]
MASRKEARKQKKGKKKKRKIVLAIIGVLLLGGLAYFVHLYNKLEDTVETMYAPLESDTEKKADIENRFKNKDTINVLLLGVDEREGDRGRSDTMVFLSLNPDTNKMLMFNIPRDTYVNIPGRGMDKINHAYAFGGSELSVQTVEDFLDTTVHFYGKVNMEGLIEGVDAIGGVTVYNDMAFSHGGYDFPEGEITLSGEEALIYSRMRKQDPRGDLGRNTRQQQIIDAMIDEAVSFESFTRVTEMLDVIGSNVETNVQIDEMRKIFFNYRGTRKETIREEIQGTGKMMDGVWYYIVSDEEVNRIRTLLEQHMNEQ